MDTTLYSALAESGLEMSKKLGGATKRSKLDMYNDIVAAVAAA